MKTNVSAHTLICDLTLSLERVVLFVPANEILTKVMFLAKRRRLQAACLIGKEWIERANTDTGPQHVQRIRDAYKRLPNKPKVLKICLKAS